MSSSTCEISRDDSVSSFRRQNLNPFAIFVIVYTTAFLLEMVEHWTHPVPTAIFLVLSIPLFMKITRFRFLLYLISTTFYLVFWRFPEVANHVNLILFTNIALIAGLSYSLVKDSIMNSDEEFFIRMQPILRLMIIVTFLVAGFHKLSFDFIDPEVSCIRTFGRSIARMAMSDFLNLGFPTALLGVVIVTIVAVLLWRRPGGTALPPIDWTAVAAPVVAMLGAGAILLALVGTASIDTPQAAAIFAVAIAVLCWQLVEGLLLLIPRYQWVGLALSLVVHLLLAMIKIVDFQAIALALLLTFIPPAVWRSWMLQAHVRIGTLRLHRAYVYLLLNLFAGLLMLIHNHVQPFIPRQYVVGGILFNLGVLIMIWPIISDLFSKNRNWRWEGVGVLRAPTPRLLYAMPAALLLFGMTSHFGLRTAGNFSMFSNLRTEGATSNHMLLGGNPLKFAAYQEDVVRIIEIDDRAARIGHHYPGLKGKALPMVEFRKLLLLWREAGRVVPLTFEYRGEITTSADIATERRWRVEAFDWEMRLLDFRVIQLGGANACRW